MQLSTVHADVGGVNSVVGSTFSLRESQTSLAVGLEDFLNWIDVGSATKVQAQVVFHGSTHDSL